ncbi:AsmA family protein [Vibrio alginolyticus]|uniref:AsmA family protein n=1 Tax=unclassified Vibrio TaxID=2614977 RepID=UPI002809672C|nr:MULTISPECIES: AsmA family protein [unclassified Vibrio]ELA6639877.1 AsmA family protein [Vibrio alginolyticus]ELB2850108.1 AsmA family protein [Vibrio alginolyticus]ELK9268706.1 AsmA family protein [Vibrio alginolyticus]ELN6906183.1 AsmA family protein [Vibrio alginolyticus]EME3980073.1 AsmA family protein [Vibrio alginolyticus]
MKKLLLILAIPIVVILVAILALTIFVNPNQFKPLIVEQAQKQTGLELVIEGDISWQFFPSIGFELGHTELRNPQGFSKPNLFKVDTVGVDISVMPLFSQQLEIGNVTLDGAEFYIETKKDGSKNIDALTKAQTQQAEQENNAAPTQNGETQTSGSDWSINLAGVTVSNGSLEMQDKQAGSYTKLYDISLNLSEFAFDNWTTADFGVKGEMNDQKFTAKGQADFKLEKGLANYALKNINFDATYSDPANKIESATIGLDTFEFDKVNNLTYAIKGDAGGMKLDMQGAGQLSVDKAISKVQLDKLTLKSTFEGDALPQSPMKVDMVSDLSFDLTKNHLSFVLEKLTANAIALDGKADVTLGDIPKVRFALHSPNIDLDEFLGLDKQAAEGNKPASGGESAPAGPEVEPDLSALKALDVKGDITIDKFKAANAKMEAVKTSFTVNRGVFELTSFSSKLYQGSISATAKLDARQSPATYSVKKSIKGVKVQPLLIDVAENDKLEGTGNIDVNVTGKSLTPTGIKKNLSGTVVINFADGAVNGINVAQLIRENYAKFKGQKVEGTNEAKKTDFSAMTATLKLNKGVVSTDNMQAQSPLLRVRGKGTANYINETVDFTISTSVVGSLEGQGGKDIDELKDITIPINVSGKWAEPKFKLVFDDVLKQKAQKEIDRGVEKLTDKIKDEKTKDAVDGLLKNLFN